MYSGLLGKTALSAAIGIVIGTADAMGFFYTVKFFFAHATTFKRIIAAALELFRLIVLIAFIIFLCSRAHMLFIPLVLCAFVFSQGGKMVFIFKGLKR